MKQPLDVLLAVAKARTEPGREPRTIVQDVILGFFSAIRKFILQRTRNLSEKQPAKVELFNGKEAQSELGLTAWTDHGWRMYDAALGRWHVVDPLTRLAKNMTGYRFGFNRPHSG